MKPTLLVLIALFFITVNSYAQPPGIPNDCAYAIVLCTSADLEFNPQGPGINDFADPDNHEGCITVLEQNSAWFYFEINPLAPPNLELGFIISPNGGFGEDYDWALFGPDVDCGALGFPIRCSSSSAQCGFCPETGMGMGTTDFTEGPGTGDGFVALLTVQPGQGFYLMIDNWLGTMDGFVMTWTDSAAPWLDCDAEPPCALSAVAGPDIDVCEGDIDVLLNGGSEGGDGGVMYEWSGTNGGTSFLNDPNLEDPSANFPSGQTGSITYTLVVTEGDCMDEDEMEVTINPLPIVSITPVDPLCESGMPHTLVGSPTGGVWGGAATGNTFDPALNGPGTHTVSYTFTSVDNCSGTAFLDIEVNVSPDVIIDPDPAEFCDNDGSILLTAFGSGGLSPYEYEWTTPSEMATGETYVATLTGMHTVVITDANGCTNSVVTTVTSHPNPDVAMVNPSPLCAGTDFFTLVGIPPGGEFDGSIVTPDGEVYPSMESPGTYTISYTYTDGNNCASTIYEDITIIDIPEVTVSNNGPLCEGQQILLFGNTDDQGTTITYEWEGPNSYSSSVQNPTDATEAGNYTLQVTVDGCPAPLITTTVVLTSMPDASALNEGPYCNGQAIQLLGATSSTGNNIVYSWTGPNGYTSDIQNPSDATEAGIYTLLITVDGCPSAPTMTEVIFNAPPDAIATNNGPYCEGELIELLGSTTSSGTTISYWWTGPNGYQSNVQNPTNAFEAGSYILIVNVDGCSSNPVATSVQVNSFPLPMITGQDSFCTGFSSTLDAGAGYANYLWNNSSTNQTLEVFSSGWRYVTVTNANGCSGIDSFQVTELASLMPQISGTLAFCAGGNTTLDAGSGYVGYSWSTTETTQTINVNTAGTFFLTVTDSDGCTGATSINTTINANPIVTIGGSTTYCIGGYSTLDAGSGYTNYLWSNDSTTQVITVDVPGTYMVTVVDVNGCIGSGDVTVSESTSLSPVITGGNAFCEGGNITLNAGAGFDTYIWSNGFIMQNLFVDVAGIYTVTVSDNQGCSGSSSVSVSEVLPPSSTVQATSSLCNTTAGGSVINLFDLVTAGDMNGSWMDANNSGASGQFTNLNFDGVTAGNYLFVYTTNSAMPPCPEEKYNVTITVIDCECADVFFHAADPLCNAGDMLDLTSIENTTESGSWSIIATPAGSNPATLVGSLFDATSGDPGQYDLQFALINQPPPGCPLDYSISIDVDDEVNAGSAAPALSFCTNEDETVDLTSLLVGADANGSWMETSGTTSQNGAFDANAATFRTLNQVPGNYTFEYLLVANGACPEDATTVSVIINAVPKVTIANAIEFDCSHAIQTLDASASTADPGAQVLWTGPGIIIDGNENTLKPTINKPGTYKLTIRNTISGCVDSASIVVQANTDIPTEALVMSQDPSCFGDQNGIISVESVAGGTPPFMYTLNSGALSTNDFFSDLPPGDYLVTIEDASGCLLDTLIQLGTPAEISIDLGSDIEIDLGEDGYFQVTVSPPSVIIDTILWTPNNLIECLDLDCLEGIIHAYNTVTLVATLYDENGCTATDHMQVLVDRSRKVYIPNAISPNGDGINDVLFISAKENQISSIKKFTIYSRWGEVLYETSAIQPNDISVGWDGRFNNEEINPGVYVYVAEIEFFDGVEEVYTGDVTVIK